MSTKEEKIKQLVKKSCGRAKSFMTPCFIRDGKSALDDNDYCIGCTIHKSKLVSHKVIMSNRKYPDDFINKIICGDCLEVMKEMPDKCVDFVFADPPYGINKAEWDKRYIFGFESEILRISRNGVAITPGQENIKACIENLSVEYKGILSAKNINGMTFNKVGFGNWIPVVLGGEIKRGQDFFEFTIRGIQPEHPSPKPFEFMLKILHRFTDEGDIILDPFLGSGTTAEACKLLHRSFIGIEINPEYCKIAEERLAQGVL